MLTEKETKFFQNILAQTLEAHATEYQGIGPTVDVLDYEPGKLRVRIAGLPKDHPLRGRKFRITIEEG